MESYQEPADSLSPLKRALLELRELRAKLAQTERAHAEPVAIVGLGLRLPGGANDPDSFWRLLADGGDAIGEIPPDRWDVERYFDADPGAPGKMYTRYGGFVQGIDRFSPQFFGISRREAESMDPQQRLLLEVAWEALEQAGQAPDKLMNSATGVFVGIANSDHFRMLAGDVEGIDAYFATGNTASVATGRLSYLLGLQGPSMAIDSACSSSLVALHLACASLRSRECDLALAGGVNAILAPEININFSKAGMMAPDGRCKTFDAAADGYVRSEGCAMVLLKRLSDARANHDHILAVIRGSAINQDGRSSTLTAPNGPAQTAVIRQALHNAVVDPGQVSYVETHGTGTALGDPIEVRALGAALCEGRTRDNPLAIGSVKTNLGHLEAAAGIAGLAKVVLALVHGEIPPHLHFATPNPGIPWESLPLVVPTALTPWPAIGGRRIAGVSSFGFSGTNAHVVVEQAPDLEMAAGGDERPVHVISLSAKTASALQEHVRRAVVHLAAHADDDAANIGWTANTGRSHFGHRLAVVAVTRAQLLERWQAFLAGQPAEGLFSGQVDAEPPEIAFLFTGHGAQYVNMGQTLYATQPTFRAALDRCAERLRSEVDQPLHAILGSASLLDRMTYAQPALFALQVALATLWQSWGITPGAVAGHSAGEYAAACVAGAFSLEDGLRLIAARGRLMDTLPTAGEMAAVLATPDEVAAVIAVHADRVSIAAINGPQDVVISGDTVAMGAVLPLLQARSFKVRRLNIPVGAHSPLVDPILDEFERIAATVSYAPPQIPLVSTLTGEPVAPGTLNANYWRRHLRRPVRFAAAIERMHADGARAFVEIGPQPTLLALGRRCLPDAAGTWLPSLRQGLDDWTQMAESVAALYAAGAPIDWDGWDRDYQSRRRRISLPTYPWERARYWSAVASARPSRHAPAPAWDRVVAAAQQQSEQGPLDLNVATYGNKWAAFDELATSYVIHALCEFGIFRQSGERRTVDELMAAKGILPTYRHLVARWLAYLVERGLLERASPDTFVSITGLLDPDLPAQLARPAPELADMAPLGEYLQRCGSQLVNVLTGRESALETLFPGGAYTTVDYMYHDWSVARYFNAIARAAIAAMGQGESLHLLEIGAGTGGTTAALLPALAPDATVYQWTDVSDFFMGRAQARFQAFPFVRYGLLDIERPPAEQGYSNHAFDVVVAANALHATRDLNTTLQHVRMLLRPGGLLVLYETARHPFWLDVTTGLIEGWQKFADEWRTDSPLLGRDEWTAALAANGFDAVAGFPAAGAVTEILGQILVIARAPAGAVETPESAGPSAPRPLASQAGPFSGAETPANAPALIAALQAALPVERDALLTDFVREHLRRILRLDPAQPVSREARLMDLGLDSLMTVELRSRLTAGLGLTKKLPATLAFDYPTVAALAHYLEQVLFVERDSAAHASPGVPHASPAIPVSPAVDIAQMSDEQVEVLLMNKLEQEGKRVAG